MPLAAPLQTSPILNHPDHWQICVGITGKGDSPTGLFGGVPLAAPLQIGPEFHQPNWPAIWSSEPICFTIVSRFSRSLILLHDRRWPVGVPLAAPRGDLAFRSGGVQIGFTIEFWPVGVAPGLDAIFHDIISRSVFTICFHDLFSRSVSRSGFTIWFHDLMSQSVLHDMQSAP